MPINDNISKVIDVDINEILPNRFQPRRQFDEDEILELSDSIREHGIIQPIVVRTVGDKYEIIAGERRYKASVLAGLETVPVIVKNLNDKESAEVALIENIQRKNLTPIEEALSYKQILDMGYLTQENLANKLGKSQSSVANKIRLLNLSDEVQEALLESKISERHARSLLRLQGEEEQNKMLDRIIAERLTVRKTDEEIDKIKNELNNSLEIKEEKEEESMNNNINMMPNMSSPQNSQPSFNFFGTTPVESNTQQLNNESIFNMGNTVDVPQTQGFDMFSNTPSPSVNISNEQKQSSLESSVQVPTFDMGNIGIPKTPEFDITNSQQVTETPLVPNSDILNSTMSSDTQFKAIENNYQTSSTNMGNTVDVAQPQSFDIFSNTPSPSINIPNIQMPSAQVETPTMPSSFDFGGIQPIMDSSSSTVQNNNTINQIPSSVNTPQQGIENNLQMPTFDMGNIAQPVSQNSGIQFDANGMIVNSNTTQVPQTAPIIEQPSLESIQTPSFSNENISEMTPVQSLEPQIHVQPEQIKVPEPIIVTDYSKQYDPIMPGESTEVQQKAPFKEIINAIRECSAKIEQYGYKIDVEEYDLSTLYQVVFKVEKQD